MRKESDCIYEGGEINLNEVAADIMEEKGWSKAELAKRSGTTLEYVERFLNNSDFTLHEFVCVWAALGKTITITFHDKE